MPATPLATPPLNWAPPSSPVSSPHPPPDPTHPRPASRALTHDARLALAASALIVFTTIHAADFRDEQGDRLEGKNTLPISYPEASRVCMLASLLLWSTALAFCWNLDPLLAAALLAMGAVVGLRFMCYRSPAADRRSYLLYNVRPSLSPHRLTSPRPRYGSPSHTSPWAWGSTVPSPPQPTVTPSFPHSIFYTFYAAQLCIYVPK